MQVNFNANVQTRNNKFFTDELSVLLGIRDCRVSSIRFSPAADLVCCFFFFSHINRYPKNLFSLDSISPREPRCVVLASVYRLHLCSSPRGQGSPTELPRFDWTICFDCYNVTVSVHADPQHTVTPPPTRNSRFTTMWIFFTLVLFRFFSTFFFFLRQQNSGFNKRFLGFFWKGNQKHQLILSHNGYNWSLRGLGSRTLNETCCLKTYAYWRWNGMDGRCCTSWRASGLQRVLKNELNPSLESCRRTVNIFHPLKR